MDHSAPSGNSSDLHAVMSSLTPFLTPETTRALRSSTTAHKSAITSAGSSSYLARKQIEELLGQSIAPAPAAHDWQLTYNLLRTLPSALYYTGSATDAEVAQKSGALLINDDYGVVTAMTSAARHSRVDAFLVLYEHEQSRLSPANYGSFIITALGSNNLSILSLPVLVAQMPNLSRAAIQTCLAKIVRNVVNPFVADFLLSRIMPALKNINMTPRLRKAIEVASYDIPNLLEESNLKPLQLAADYGRLKIVQLMLSHHHGENVVIDKPIRRGYTEIVRLLLDAGVVDIKPDYLELAVASTRTEMVVLLLSHDLPTVLTPKLMQAALLVAVDNRLTDIAALLQADARIGQISPETLQHIAANVRVDGVDVEAFASTT